MSIGAGCGISGFLNFLVTVALGDGALAFIVFRHIVEEWEKLIEDFAILVIVFLTVEAEIQQESVESEQFLQREAFLFLFLIWVHFRFNESLDFLGFLLDASQNLNKCYGKIVKIEMEKNLAVSLLLFTIL